SPADGTAGPAHPGAPPPPITYYLIAFVEPDLVEVDAGVRVDILPELEEHLVRPGRNRDEAGQRLHRPERDELGEREERRRRGDGDGARAGRAGGRDGDAEARGCTRGKRRDRLIGALGDAVDGEPGADVLRRPVADVGDVSGDGDLLTLGCLAVAERDVRDRK